MSNPIIELLNMALKEVRTVRETADNTFDLLQKNISQVRDQRVGLMHQEQMLIELINKSGKLMEKEENDIKGRQSITVDNGAPGNEGTQTGQQ